MVIAIVLTGAAAWPIDEHNNNPAATAKCLTYMMFPFHTKLLKDTTFAAGELYVSTTSWSTAETRSFDNAEPLISGPQQMRKLRQTVPKPQRGQGAYEP